MPSSACKKKRLKPMRLLPRLDRRRVQRLLARRQPQPPPKALRERHPVALVLRAIVDRQVRCQSVSPVQRLSVLLGLASVPAAVECVSSRSCRHIPCAFLFLFALFRCFAVNSISDIERFCPSIFFFFLKTPAPPVTPPFSPPPPFPT